MILEKKIQLLVVLLLPFLFAAQWTVLPAFASEPRQSAAVEELWIDMSIGPPLIPLFNDMARGDDIARIENPRQIGQLRGIEKGQKMVIFKSIEETEQFLPDMAGEIDIIGYNLEHSPATPANEQEDPVGSIQQMRDLADEYDLKLAFGPDHDFALSHGVDIAPYVDIFVLQIQRQQTNSGTVKAFVEPIVPELHAANPDLEVSVQVRTEGDVQEIVALIESLDAELSGVSILTSPDTVDVAEALVAALRPGSTGFLDALAQNIGLLFLLTAGVIALVMLFIYRRQRPSQEVKNDQPLTDDSEEEE